ncbi:MAG: BMP family protein [Lachnospiraceae bacterium]|nr:BMP family protein [Lachnospiraceae bacterium]
MKLKKIVALALTSVMAISLLTACGGSASSSEAAPAESKEESAVESVAESSAEETAESTEIDYSALKIGVMLSGSANDGGWSQMGADAAGAAAEKYGCEVNYTESIASTDYEAIMKGYADAGYNIIVSHGAEFLDTAKLIAPDYPDVFFICTSAQSGQEPNVAGVDFATFQLGFLNGVAAAMATEAGKIGAIGSNEIDSIIAWVAGVEAGAKYINPDVEVLSVYTGSYDDQLKAKQSVKALEEQGVDVITQNADACGIGAIQQCDEDGLINVGAVSDQTVEGESCFLSVIQDAKLGIEIAVEKAIAGELPAGANVMGADVGVISLSSYSGKYADKLTDEQKAQIEELWELSKTTDLATLVE